MTKITLLIAAALTLIPQQLLAQNPQPSSQPKPCTSAPYRHFDFWIGSWQVTNKEGKHVGNSEIKSIMNGCAISEHWTSVSGYQGVSYNFYDKSKKQWHQTWIGVDGNPLYLDGNFVQGKMTLEGETKGKGGKVIKQKITWTKLANDRVSQHWQISNDNGKTWTDSFLGFYGAKPEISFEVGGASNGE